MRMRFQTMLEAYEAGLGLSAPRTTMRRGTAWLRNWLRPSHAFQFGYAVVLLALGGLVGHFLPLRKADTGEMAQLRNEIHSMRELVTVSLLQQDSASERLQGVSWSRLVRQPDEKVLDALIAALNHDSSVNVRLAAVDALYRFSDRPVARQGLLQALVRQDSPLVQIALIDAMVELREKESAEVLRKLSGDANVNQVVRERARWGLQQLS
jgi:HEAT repeat protein